MNKFERLAKTFIHPTQIAILSHLEEHEEASPNEMSNALGIALGQLSYHVKVLLQAAPPDNEPFLELARTQPVRGAVEHFYRLPKTKETQHVEPATAD